MSPRLELRGGSISGVLHGGALRWIRVNDHEVVRLVGFIVRDRTWGTLTPRDAQWRLSRSDGSQLFGKGVFVCEGATLAWSVEIKAESRELEVGLKARATGRFVTNRAGLVALLPTLTWAGVPTTAMHCDGETTDFLLPLDVAPHQPATNLKGLRAGLGENSLQLAFEGDVFEMEDQRNWTDPSYKLYSRPLSRPYPYTIEDGEEINQRIVMQASSGTARFRARRPAFLAGAPPTLATEARSSVPVAETHRAADDAGLGHFVIRTLADASYLRLAVQLSALSSTIVVLRDSDYAAVDHLLRSQHIPARFVMEAFSSALAAGVRSLAPQVEIGAGTARDFAVVNRSPPKGDFDFLAFSICPSVHDLDAVAVMESLEALPDVLASAQTIAGNRPLDIIGASFLRSFDSKTDQPVPIASSNQDSLLAAAWALCLYAAGAGRIRTLALYELSGPRGILSPDSVGGSCETEVSLVIRALQSFDPVEVEMKSFSISGFAEIVLKGEKEETWLVNVSGSPQELCLLEYAYAIVSDREPRWALLEGGAAHVVPSYGIIRYRPKARVEV